MAKKIPSLYAKVAKEKSVKRQTLEQLRGFAEWLYNPCVTLQEVGEEFAKASQDIQRMINYEVY